MILFIADAISPSCAEWLHVLSCFRHRRVREKHWRFIRVPGGVK